MSTYYIDVFTMNSKNFLQLNPLSGDNLFLMTGSLEVTHKLIFTIPSVIQISSNPIQQV